MVKLKVSKRCPFCGKKNKMKTDYIPAFIYVDCKHCAQVYFIDLIKERQ